MHVVAPRAGQKVRRVNGLRRFTITLLRVTDQMENLADGGDWRL